MVIIVNHTIYLKFDKKVDFKYSYHTHTQTKNVEEKKMATM